MSTDQWPTMQQHVTTTQMVQTPKPYNKVMHLSVCGQKVIQFFNVLKVCSILL